MTVPIANVLQPLIDVAEAILKFWHDDVGLSWGGAIIGLTVVVRLAILPLTFKQVRSMQELQRLQPEMKRLQERYKDDRQRLNQEMMKLYQEHKVNPLGSCLPILLQLPFFISLFYLLRGDEFQQDIKGEESFLFIDNLAEPATGGTLVVLIVLYVVTQLISGLVSTVTADPTQRRIMLALPFVFVIFIINFNAGLIVYWITTNCWTIGQQLLVRKLFPKPPPIEAKPDAGSKPARGKPPPKPAAAAAVADGKAKGSKAAKGETDGGPRKGPPPGPRKKKKRTGRRR
jgi:YidC/Oxa1 family membrane protein insertase